MKWSLFRPLNRPIGNWRGQRVWIIGASSGIGAALSEALLQLGARVALSARNRAALDLIAARYEDAALILPLDVTDGAQMQTALREITSAWGGLDLALFVAGTHAPMRADNFDLDAAKRLFDVNVTGVLHGLQAVLPLLLSQRSGGIGIVSSVAGYRGLPTALAYGASKAALINLAETLYLDLAPKNIGVYLIAPGFVKTPLTDKNDFTMPALIGADEAAREIVRGIEKGRFEIHFPKRFTSIVKLMRLLPHRLYFYLVRKGTGL